MDTVTISDARRFSLDAIQKTELLATGDLRVSLLCFEAGQRDEEAAYGRTIIYQVLEGEVLVRGSADSRRLGPGKLLTVAPGTTHLLENAGGGLLVVLATQAG